MCEKAVEDEPESLEYVPNHFKTEEMFEKAAEDNPWSLEYVPDCFKTKKMCKRCIEDDPSTLELIGLLQGSGWGCDMMTIMMMIIGMMVGVINFLCGTMVMRPERPKKQK